MTAITTSISQGSILVQLMLLEVKIRSFLAIVMKKSQTTRSLL